MNDANCAALAEVGRDLEVMWMTVCSLLVALIGGAVVKDRMIHKGKHLHGGEFGYMVALNDLDNDSYISWSTAGSTVATVKGVAKELGVDYQTLDGKVILIKHKITLFIKNMLIGTIVS